MLGFGLNKAQDFAYNALDMAGEGRIAPEGRNLCLLPSLPILLCATCVTLCTIGPLLAQRASCDSALTNSN